MSNVTCTHGPRECHNSGPAPVELRPGHWEWSPGDGTRYEFVAVPLGYDEQFVALINIGNARGIRDCDVPDPGWVVENTGLREYEARVLCSFWARALVGGAA